MGMKDIPRSGAGSRTSLFGASRVKTAEQQLAAPPPDWAKDTSHIMTAEEGKESLGYAQSQAESLLSAAPAGSLTEGQMMSLEEAKEKGFVEKGFSGLMGALEFIDRPRKLMSLSIRDILGQDEGAGKTSFGLDAYADVLLGKNERLVDKYGEDQVGRGGYLTFSSLLDDAWVNDDDDAWWDKFARGLVSFGGDVLIDPITYATFGMSAVGVKGAKLSVTTAGNMAGKLSLKRAIAGTVDDAVETAWEASMRKGIIRDSDDIYKRLVSEQAEALGDDLAFGVPQDVLRKQAMEEAAGSRFYNQTTKRWEVDPEGFHGGVVGDEVQRVLTTVTNRDFGTLKREMGDYINHVFTRRTGTQLIGDEVVDIGGLANSYANRLGDSFTTGGMRIGNPFSVKVQSRPIKFTQGAFQDTPGLRRLHQIPQSRAGKFVGRLMPFVDADAPMAQVARQRFLDPNSPLARMTYGQLDWVTRQAEKAAIEAGDGEALMSAVNQTKHLLVQMKDEGMSADKIDEVYSMLLPSVNVGKVHPTIESGGYSPAVVEAFTDAMNGMTASMARSFDVVRRLVPGMGEIENYVPVVFDKEFIKAIRGISESTGARFSGDDLERAARRFSQNLDGEEISVEEMALFMEAYESLVAKPAGQTAIGTTSSVRRRTIGTYLGSIDETSQSSVLFDVQPKGARTFVDRAEMNDVLAKVLRGIEAEPDSGIRFGPDADAFLSDPIKVIQNYVAEMTGVAQQRAFLNAAQAVGSARTAGVTLNADHLMYQMGQEFFDGERALVERAIAETKVKIQDQLARTPKMKKVSLGSGASIEFPAEIVDMPPIKAAVKKMRRLFRRIEDAQAGYQKRLEANVRHHMNKGLSEDHARMIATADVPELRTLRAEYNAAIEDAYGTLENDLRRAWFEGSRDGQHADEMIQGARDHVAYLKKKQKATWQAVEDQYMRTMDADWDRFPMVDKTLEAIADPSDAVSYQALIESVLAPVRKSSEEKRARLTDWLMDQVADAQERRVAASTELDKYTKQIVDGADPNQELQRRTLATMAAADSEMGMLNDVLDAVLSARAIDEDVVLAATQAAQTRAARQAAEYVADTWNDVIEAGINARRAAAAKQGKGSHVADRVERLWFGDEQTPKSKPLAEWTDEELGFYRVAKAGRGNLIAWEMDTPWFWQIVADGVEEDWRVWRSMADDPFFKDVVFDERGASFISKAEIVSHLDTRVEKLQKAVDDLTEIRKVDKANAKTGRKTLLDKSGRPYRSGETIPYPDGTDKIRGMVDVSGDPNATALPLLTLMDKLEALKLDQVALAAGDSETVRRYITNHMAGRFQGILADADWVGSRATRGLQVGDSVVAAERAFRDLASAATEPISTARLAAAVETVNRQMADVPGGMRLRANADGTVTVFREVWERKPIPPLKYLTDGVASGQITREMLEAQGLGYVAAIADVSGALQMARRTAASMAGPRTALHAKLARSLGAFDDFMQITEDIIAGKATAEKLRRWAFDGSRSGGSVSESKQFSDMLAVLPVDKQAQARRLVDSVMAADERVTAKGARLFAEEHEASWNKALFKPLEETFNNVDAESARLLSEARMAETVSAQQFLLDAEDFLKQLSFVEEWRRTVAPKGTALDSYAKRLGPEGEQSLRQAMGDLRKAAKRLRTEGPYTLEDLVGVKARKGYGETAEQVDEATRKSVLQAAEIAMSRETLTPTAVFELADGTKLRIVVDGVNVIALDHGRVVGALIGTSIGVVKGEAFEGQGLGTYMVRQALKEYQARGVDLDEILGELVSLSEQGANVVNRALKGSGRKIKARELGFTKAHIKKMYGGEGKIAKAVTRSEVPESVEGMADPATFGLGGILDGYLIDPVVGAIFRNMVEGQKYLYTPEGIGELRSGVKAILDWWRPAATIANPSFHVRNAISGVANGMMIGVGPHEYPKIIKQYAKFKRAYNNLGMRLADGTVVDVKYVIGSVDEEFRPMFQAALDQQILGTGFARGDVAREVVSGGATLNPTDKDRFVLFRAGGKTMEDMEDVMRLTTFYKYYDPLHPESAAMAQSMVMMVHFDYKNLAQMEHRFKRIAPFFIWTRRNVPLQVRALIEKPGYAASFNHFSQAMQDNLGSEEYRNSPLPSWYGSLAMPTGIGHREGGPEWARFVWDPDLPLGNLEDLPLFKRDKDSMLPFSSAALDPVEWLTWGSQLMGPQFSLPVDLMFKGEEGDYETNAPAGLNEIGLLLENIDFFDLLEAEGSDWRWSGAASQTFNTAIPFYKNFTGAFENNPGRASRQGMPNDPGVADRFASEIMGLFGAGTGVKLQTPSASGSASFDTQEMIREMRRKSKVAAGDNPLSPGT